MSTRTFVAGTAGHVDHGKSSLVRALTGTDPDRLAEEQLRQMTIDLGFAELTTPAGNRLHLIDVPGHERFVRNMLAGAGGIDTAILTIAADDGPMPQTREHLAILDLLGIERGVVALSKADLVDEDWLGFIGESIRELLRGTHLADAEIVPISSLTGYGLTDLLSALDNVLQPLQRSIDGVPRLPIDRVFSMPGFGTVVTGTLLDGPLRVGDRVTIRPGERESRVRGLQTFGSAEEVALPGSRVAVNLTGIETSELARGQVLTLPGAPSPAMRLDARVSLLASASRPLHHNDEVVVFTGSSETPGRVALLDREELPPGENAWVQLRLSRPIAVLPRDRFILRRPSPAETIGGGQIVELDAPRHKRNQSFVVERLEQLAKGDPADAALAWLGTNFVPGSQFRQQVSPEVLERLLETNRIRMIGVETGQMVVAAPVFERVEAQLRALVDAYHRQHPLEPGIDRENLLQQLGVSRTVLDALLVAADGIEQDGSRVRRNGFRIELGPDQQHIADRYLAVLRSAGFQPPTPDDAGIPLPLIRAMVAMESLVPVGEGIFFLPERIEEGKAILLAALETNSSISLAEYRDLLGASRKYTQALLEYFDGQRITRRAGDRRVAARSVQRMEDDSAR